ncbi:Serine/threonine-protein kinase pkn1 [Planctomycetes bacterium Pla163]|uniref:Serine/threonine-protein kinase pkn1 n=1 Tax=Rohdeia mirabilis TaxID=2528008 RepID=A0A518D2A4_9BACT|nr:Serine/threonine-protein kinase pkn1 [Planctomycetes bacterium Pla163]
MRPPSLLLVALAALALPTLPAQAQTSFGTSCAGASGVTPELSIIGPVQSGQPWTLEVTAPGGLGLGYLLVGFSNTSASALGGVPLPLDLGAFFADPLWGGCELAIDPSYQFLPYTFDPNANGGLWSKNFPGFDTGQLYLQALNIDADFTTRIAGVSQGMLVSSVSQFVPGMVPIAPGTFDMGSNAPSGAPYFGSSVEQPVHSVTISQPFWMGQHEVTQAEYEALMGSNPAFYLGANRPVERVTWFDAVAYCQALTAQESALGNVPAGYEYRLPTEAEWEYACRAGTTTEFNVGDELFCSDARFDATYHPTGNFSSCGNPPGTVDVGSYAPNAWGLFDMQGNVWEWCLDSFASYPAGPVTDPFVTGGSLRVYRGGSWNGTSGNCRSADRDGTGPGFPGFDVGFRVVLAPVLVP